MFVYFKILSDNIRFDRVAFISPDTRAAVISLYESVTNLTFIQYSSKLHCTKNEVFHEGFLQ